MHPLPHNGRGCSGFRMGRIIAARENKVAAAACFSQMAILTPDVGPLCNGEGSTGLAFEVDAVVKWPCVYAGTE